MSGSDWLLVSISIIFKSFYTIEACCSCTQLYKN